MDMHRAQITPLPHNGLEFLWICVEETPCHDPCLFPKQSWVVSSFIGCHVPTVSPLATVHFLLGTGD